RCQGVQKTPPRAPPRPRLACRRPTRRAHRGAAGTIADSALRRDRLRGVDTGLLSSPRLTLPLVALLLLGALPFVRVRVHLCVATGAARERQDRTHHEDDGDSHDGVLVPHGRMTRKAMPIRAVG